MAESRALYSSLGTYREPGHPLVGRYVLGREIGTGGMATVFLARDLTHDRDVAVKFLNPELTSAVATDRFNREITIAAGLTHPHILPVHDSGSVDGLLYYVMPFVEGENLAGRIAREKKLPIDEAVRIAREVGSALAFAHERGIVHRDIKPANVLLPGGVAVVADFGLARALEREHRDTRLTEPGVSLGTPVYMSPEQAVGEHELDGRADEYSLACVLYEMITGHPPFVGETFQRLLSQHLTETPVPVSRYRPTVPPAVDEAIARALSKNPADRFRTVAEFVRAVDVSGPASLAGSPAGKTTGAFIAAMQARPRLIVGALVVGGLVLAAFGLRSWRHAGRPSKVLDDNLLAVAPFVAFDARLQVWEEGLVDVLSRNFDGFGPLRTVSPSLVMRRFSGRADQTTATDLARATGAGLAVYGQLLKVGGDSVRARVTLRDVKRDSTIGEVELLGTIDHIDRVADSITVRMLRQLGNVRSIAAVPRTFFGSKSLPALKLFLQGEQLYRHNELSAARTAYEQTLALDSSFALAYRRMRGVIRVSETDTVAMRYAARAGALNHGMPPRDSMLILADSLAVAHQGNEDYADSTWLQSLHRRLATLEAAAQRYPEDPEVWTELGEARVHWGFRVGVDDRRALEAFENALRVDSLYGPAFYHAIDLSMTLRGPDSVAALIRRYKRINPGDAAFAIVERVVSGMPMAGVIDQLDRTTVDDQQRAVSLLWRLNDARDAYTTLTSRMLPRLSPAAQASFRRSLVRRSLYRGRPRAAYALIDSASMFSGSANFMGSVLALSNAGLMPDSSADRVFRRVLPRGSPNQLSLAAAWWGHQHDTASIRAVIAASLNPRRPLTADRATGFPYARGVGEAYLKLARGDTLGAVDAFLAVPDSAAPSAQAPIRADVARLLMARGRFKEAAAYLDRRPPRVLGPDYWEVAWRLERARVADRLGDRARALAEYRFVTAAWSNADPELRAEAAEARDAVRRLETPPGN